MAATKKAAWFKTNPGGSEVLNVPVLPGANGTWANATSATAATQDTGMAAAGYLSFDFLESGALQEFRIPFFRYNA
jgi:hypothetical protein